MHACFRLLLLGVSEVKVDSDQSVVLACLDVVKNTKLQSCSVMEFLWEALETR